MSGPSRRRRLQCLDPIPSESRSTLAHLMEQPTLDTGKAVRPRPGERPGGGFGVRRAGGSRRQKRNGEAFLKLRLGDMTAVRGRRLGRAWSRLRRSPRSARSCAWRATSPSTSAAARPSRCAACAPPTSGEYDPADLVECPPVAGRDGALAATSWWARSSSRTCAAARAPRSAAVEAGRRWREAPAAKHYHQAYRHGLLEHCLSVAQGVQRDGRRPVLRGIDRDIAVTGALLHDIGKVEAYPRRTARSS